MGNCSTEYPVESVDNLLWITIWLYLGRKELSTLSSPINENGKSIEHLLSFVPHQAYDASFRVTGHYPIDEHEQWCVFLFYTKQTTSRVKIQVTALSNTIGLGPL